MALALLRRHRGGGLFGNLRRDFRGPAVHRRGHDRPELIRNPPRFVQLPNPTGVAAGGMFSCNLPIGEDYRYHALFLQLGGTTMDNTHISQLRLKLNGTVFHTVSGTDLDKLNKYAKLPGYAGGTGMLPIWFERPWLADVADRYATCINTTRHGTGQARNGVSQFSIEGDIDGTAVAPTVALRAMCSRAHPAQAQFLPRRDYWTENMAATGDYQLAGRLLFGNRSRAFLQRLYLMDTNAHLTAFNVYDQGTPIFNLTSLDNEAVQSSGNLVSPQTGMCVIDYGAFGDATRVYPIARSQWIEAHVTVGTVNNACGVYMDSLGHSFD